jgi:aspartate/methionine/tyrosine aminotransferase
MPIEQESPEQFGYDKIKVNLTESSIADNSMHDFGLKAELDHLLLSYGDHKGLPELRSLLAKNYGNCSPENIIVSAGAVLALFIINATLLDAKNDVVVIHPNYGANIEVPRSLNVPTHLVSLNLASEFALDVDAVKKAITPATRLISITYPHNPTGSLLSDQKLKEVIVLAEEHDCYVLVDETYRELTFGEKLPTAASLSDRAISVESLSKAFGVPGIRIGWLACRDDALIEKFLATKEQVSICNSLVDENLAYSIL